VFKFGIVNARAGAARVDQPAIRVVIGKQQRAEPGPGAFGISPADHHEFLAVQAFDFQPHAAIAGSAGRIYPLRDDPFHFQGAGVIVEGSPVPDMVIAEMLRRAGARQQGARRSLRSVTGIGAIASPSRWRRSNRKKTRAPLLPVSDAFWIRLNEVVPSGRTPHNSPSS
jgi:hypothetical protein